MNISKDKILADIYDAMGTVADLGCSEELTALSVQLGEIAERAELMVDGILDLALSLKDNKD